MNIIVIIMLSLFYLKVNVLYWWAALGLGQLVSLAMYAMYFLIFENCNHILLGWSILDWNVLVLLWINVPMSPKVNKNGNGGYQGMVLKLLLATMAFLAIGILSTKYKVVKLLKVRNQILFSDPPKEVIKVKGIKLEDLWDILSPWALIGQGFFLILALTFVVKVIPALQVVTTMNT